MLRFQKFEITYKRNGKVETAQVKAENGFDAEMNFLKTITGKVKIIQVDKI